MTRFVKLLTICTVAVILALSSCVSEQEDGCETYNDEPNIYGNDVETWVDGGEAELVTPPEPTLALLHLTHDEFFHSINNPRSFPEQPAGRIVAGVVPHHNTAAVLISGFFSQAARFDETYDLVIILAPNHEGDLANVVLSYRDWNIGSGVPTHRGFVGDLMADENINSVISHYRMEREHSASILIPYIYHYLPGTPVAPVLLNRLLNFSETIELFDWMNNWINESGKNVLLVASIDFSHFLTIGQSRMRDAATKEAVLSNDLRRIHEMNYHNLDSPAAMIMFLMYLQELGIDPKIVAHTDASEFLGSGIEETTSYMVIIGVEKEVTQVRLTFTGDIMLHQAQFDAALDPAMGGRGFDYAFSAVSLFLQSADLTVGNLETVLAGFFMDDDRTIFPRFSAPDEFAAALRNAGFDLLSTANNHALDQGVEGLLRTIDVLGDIGISNFGTYRSLEARNEVLVREVGGIRFAFLSYTFSTNGQPIPNGREYLVNIMREGLIKADIARAREVADFVVVMPHMGYEYELVVRETTEDWAMMMLLAGADIVVAGHPHVVQPMGFVDIVERTGETRRGFVAYCLGNFISSQRKPNTYTGVILNLYFERVGDAAPTFAAYSYIATRVIFSDGFGNPNVKIILD